MLRLMDVFTADIWQLRYCKVTTRWNEEIQNSRFNLEAHNELSKGYSKREERVLIGESPWKTKRS